jgi:two-component system OmpR family sensor kinase
MRQFSAALAHELRTPLASLRGTIELALRKPQIADEDRTALASQIEDVDRLTRLIDRVLTMARAESGQLRLRHDPVDLGILINSLVEQLELVAESAGITLRCECANGLVVSGDEGWLSQLLLNLVDNALKYAPRDGRVTVRAAREGDLARIDVEDTGIGLSEEDAARVFERFFRADPARSSATEGAGLGLSLVQWIAIQHQGNVTVSSQLGQGSTFSVTLPLAAEQGSS